MSSAIFEVRRFIFGSLPVDSLRAVVLAGEDEAGRICIDGDIEVAYQRCRFRWFQLTQNVRRMRTGLRRREKVRTSTRFLVMHVSRGSADPPPPRRASVPRLPAVLFNGSAAATLEVLGDGEVHGGSTPQSGADIGSFSNW